MIKLMASVIPLLIEVAGLNQHSIVRMSLATSLPKFIYVLVPLKDNTFPLP